MEKTRHGNGADRKPLSWIENVSELVKRLCLSVSHCLMYSSEHPVAAASVRATADWMVKLLQHKKHPISLNVVNRQIVFEGLPLEEKNEMAHRLAHFLEKVSALDLRIQPGLTLRDVTRFHEMISLGAKEITAGGGLSVCLEKHRVNHILVRESRYVLLTDKQRVVNATDKVVPAGAGGTCEEKEIIHFLADTVLKGAQVKQWLLHEIENDPTLVAARVAEGIKIAASRAEAKSDPTAAGLDILLHNIEVLGRQLRRDAADGQQPVELKRAMNTIRQELHTRADQLQSTDISRRFLNQIMRVIATISDQTLSGCTAEAGHDGRNDLLETERMMRDLDAQHQDPRDSFRGTYRPHRGPGIGAAGAKAKPAASGKVYDLNVDCDLEEALVGSKETAAERLEQEEGVAELLEKKLQEKDESIAGELESLKRQCKVREAFLNRVAFGIVIWGEDNGVHFLNATARKMLGIDREPRIRPVFVAYMRKLKVPLENVPLQLRMQRAETHGEMRLLRRLRATVMDDNGNAIGVLLGNEQSPKKQAEGG